MVPVSRATIQRSRPARVARYSGTLMIVRVISASESNSDETRWYRGRNNLSSSYEDGRFFYMEQAPLLVISNFRKKALTELIRR